MAETKIVRERPLSPHLGIYRFTLTMGMSIAHRITGMALYAGTVVLVAWLVAAASGERFYDWFMWLAATPIGWLGSLLLTFSLIHHAIGGIRHLIWDLSLGLDDPVREWLTLGSLVASLVLTVIVWGAGFALFLRG